jgi:hypothetical protein
MGRSGRSMRSLLAPPSKVVDEPQEGLWFYGFVHKGGCPGFPGPLPEVPTSRHYNYRNVGQLRLLAQFGKEVPTIEYWHREIQKNEFRPSFGAGQQLESFGSIRRALNSMSPEGEEFGEGLAQLAIIVHNQDH